MPTIKRIGPYRFFFYSDEPDEPAHIHVKRDDHTAKFWLQPVALAKSGRFKRKEIRDMRRLVEEHQAEFLEAWYDSFDR